MSYESGPEETLQELYASGNAAALAALIERHYPELRAQALMQLGGLRDYDEKDALQDLFVKLLSATSYDPAKSWLPFAQRTLQNLIHDICRRRAVTRYCLPRDCLKALRSEGILEEVLLKLLELLGKTFVGEGRFQQAVAEQLTTAELERHYEQIRRHAKRLRGPAGLADQPPKLGEPPPDLISWRRKLEADIRAGVAKMELNMRVIFSLRYWHGWEFIDIAQTLSDEPNSNLVAGKYYRAVRILNSWLVMQGYSIDREGGIS